MPTETTHPLTYALCLKLSKGIGMSDIRMADMRAAYDLGHKAGVKLVEDYIEDQQDLKLVMERRGGPTTRITLEELMRRLSQEGDS